MKKTLHLAALLLPVCLLFLGSNLNEQGHFIRTEDDPIIEFPEDVKGIIDNKCYGCHSHESKSVMAKGKLIWDELAELEASKLIKKLDDIVEVIEDGSMPPSKYLKQNPDASLSDEEMKLLRGWAEKTTKGLSK